MSRDGKFASLTQYFSELKADEITMTFEQIEKINGEKLSDSAYKYPAYWSPSKTHTITKSWIDNGYTISNLNSKMHQVTFIKNISTQLAPIIHNVPTLTDESSPVIRKKSAICIEKVLSGINKFYSEIESEENARYLSWEHCYKAFQEAHSKPVLTDSDVDLLSLHLAFYLASWGMLRGSSFLLQKDYRVHIDIVKELFIPAYRTLWGISCNELEKQQNLNILMNLVERLKAIYSVKRKNIKEVDTDISDILVTKVLLGTLGCVPAYDEYFKKGVSKYNITTQLLGISSIRGLVAYYKDNEKELEDIRISISQARQVEYPQMKILDMAFWRLGFDYDKTSAKDSGDSYSI